MCDKCLYLIQSMFDVIQTSNNMKTNMETSSLSGKFNYFENQNTFMTYSMTWQNLQTFQIIKGSFVNYVTRKTTFLTPHHPSLSQTFHAKLFLYLDCRKLFNPLSPKAWRNLRTTPTFLWDCGFLSVEIFKKRRRNVKILNLFWPLQKFKQTKVKNTKILLITLFNKDKKFNALLHYRSNILIEL